jgi:ABC-type multidrug transport system fused ATPase/permease subunit
MKLLAGYMRPESGAISVDGLNLMDTKLRDYYHHIGYLTQEPSVFDGTIRENLTYALDSEPEESELDTVIRQSECQFIYEWKK